MRPPHAFHAGLLVLIALASACSAGGPQQDTRAGKAGPRFEQVDVPGVTSDRASTGGASWIDFDADGDLDLFVTNGYDVSDPDPRPQPNQLYRNDGPGGFKTVNTGPLAEVEAFSSGHTWGDYDNDGDLDLFIANQRDQNNLLFRNEGDGNFSRVEGEPPVGDGGHSYAAGWVDVDNDGWLDLFVANGGLSHAGPNRLFRGTADGHFVPVTEGAIVTDEASTCGFAWGDYDNDGDADLFVANQGFDPATNSNVLYRNDGEWTFTPVLDSPVGRDHLPSSAATWADIDNDQDLDLHVTSLYGLADLLLLNDGQGGLVPVTDSPLTLEGGYGMDANWEDYDNDGDLDLAVANWGSGAYLFLNDGTGNFSRSPAGDLTRSIHYTGTMASADYDADGDMDILIAGWPNHPGPGEWNRLYRNAGNENHWLQVSASIGARVLVTSGEDDQALTQMREIVSHTGFRGQSAMTAHFGLGSAGGPVSIEVRWPSGKRATREAVPVDRLVEIVEP